MSQSMCSLFASLGALFVDNSGLSLDVHVPAPVFWIVLYVGKNIIYRALVGILLAAKARMYMKFKSDSPCGYTLEAARFRRFKIF